MQTAGHPLLTNNINQFKNGIFNLLIATSVAARGLDVKSMVLVVNFDVPTHFEDYVHRVGRTGRAGRKGTAVTFIAPDEERHAPELVKALNTANKKNKVQTKIPGALTKLSDSYLEKKRPAPPTCSTGSTRLFPISIAVSC